MRVASLARADAAAVRRELEAEPAGFALTARQAALAQDAVSTTDGQAAGSQAQHRLLLVVDQFEQLFTQCPDEGQRRAFVTALHAAAASTRAQTSAALVVLSVRADFEARCADYPQLADAVQDRYLVTSMTDRQLRMAITEPAKQAGSRVEDDLVEALLREISTRGPVSSSAFPASGPISGAGVLPLLSHALDQAWRHRTGRHPHLRRLRTDRRHRRRRRRQRTTRLQPTDPGAAIRRPASVYPADRHQPGRYRHGSSCGTGRPDRRQVPWRDSGR